MSSGLDSVSATAVIDAPAAVIFAVLADPATHAAIDGTGRVRDSLDRRLVEAAGQTFRVAMYHENHPDGEYEMVNEVQVFEPPRVISWKPGYDTGDGSLSFGGWLWRYDLDPIGPSRTSVTLTYDWSAVPETVRERFAQFPPFPSGHLDDSLARLARLATS